MLPKGSDQFITFQLLNVHSPAQSTLTGSIHTSILLDQLKHDEWILMQRMDGVRTDSRLLVTIQHLYSEEEYYKAMIGYWDQHIKKQNGNIERNKKYLQQIYNPNDFLMTVAHGDFYIKRLRPTQEMGSVETIDPAYTALRMTPPTAHHPMFSLAGLLGFGLVVMCMLMLYHRACFDTVVAAHQMAVGLLLIGFFFLKLDFTQKGLGITALFLVVSVIMDIAWIFAFRKVPAAHPDHLRRQVRRRRQPEDRPQLGDAAVLDHAAEQNPGLRAALQALPDGREEQAGQQPDQRGGAGQHGDLEQAARAQPLLLRRLFPGQADDGRRAY